MEKVQRIPADLEETRRELLQKLWESFQANNDNGADQVNADMTSLSIKETFTGECCRKTCLATFQS